MSFHRFSSTKKEGFWNTPYVPLRAQRPDYFAAHDSFVVPGPSKKQEDPAQSLAARGSESVPVADAIEARVDDVVKKRAEAVAEPEAEAGLVIGLELSAPQENLL